MNTSNITNYKTKDFTELLGVSVKKLQRCDRKGTLKANRTPTNRCYYTYDQYGLRKYKKQIGRDAEIAKELQGRNKSDRGTKSQNS